MEYIDTEIKILDILDVGSLEQKIVELGAIKIFDDLRSRYSFDNKDHSFLSNKIELRITDEGTKKLSLDNENDHTSIKLKISDITNMIKILDVLGFTPVSLVQQKRISYELDDVDFDIDIFPNIPPFLEIDTNGDDIRLKSLIETLGLTENKAVTWSTIEVFSHYGKDYLKEFAINK